MIGKGKAIAHTQASMNYGMKKEKNAEIIHSQFVNAETPRDITQEFLIIQDQNERCQKKTLSFVLSPTIKDGEKLSNKQLKEITERFLKEMQLKEHQSIAFVHRNREHTHIHLYVNRIGFNGQTYKDNFIGKRSQQAAERVAQDMGLKTVREVQADKLNEMSQIRTQIKRIHDKVIQNDRPRNFDTYIDQMRKNQVEVKPYINKQGKLQGFRFEYKGHELKGSAVHRSMSMGNISQRLNLDRETIQGIKKTKSISLAGKAVPLSSNLAVTIAKKAIKIVLKRALQQSTGIEI